MTLTRCGESHTFGRGQAGGHIVCSVGYGGHKPDVGSVVAAAALSSVKVAVARRPGKGLAELVESIGDYGSGCLTSGREGDRTGRGHVTFSPEMNLEAARSRIRQHSFDMAHRFKDFAKQAYFG